MKRGRDDDKVMGPLFPRLHVNDADKGGPRAPPRNKMALYEQLSIPSQRFGSGGAPSLALPPHHGGGLVPSASLTQVCGQERSVLSPCYVASHLTPHAVERTHNHLAGLNTSTMRTELEKKSQKPVSQRMMYTAGNEHSGAECSSLRPHGISSAKESSKKLGGNDDFRVPILSQPTTVRQTGEDQNLVNREIRTHFDTGTLQKNGKTVIRSATCAQKNGNDATKDHSSGDADRNDDGSETSIVDSLSGVGLSPDDVVDVIGPKHFWKARRAIVNQQRVLALQVFEPHMLIKVQKLIAESPHLLIDEATYLHGSPPKGPVKDRHTNSVMKRQQLIDKKKEESLNVERNSECPVKYMGGNHSLHHEDDNCKERQLQISSTPAAYMGGNHSLQHEDDNCKEDDTCKERQLQSSAPAASEDKSWPHHLPGNQWLIPVMSATEGLIYKPFTGPCPPPGAIMAPIYGGCAAPSVNLSAGDFMSPSCAVPTSHKQQSVAVLPGAPAVVPNFFLSPIGLQVVNPVASCTAVKHVRSLAGPSGSSQKELHSSGSCNMSNPKNKAFSECARRVQMAKDSDVQGSTASSPSERLQEGGVPPPLFPIASAEEHPEPHPRNQQPRVIKVVPHNRRTATESAARIFQSIQRERQRNDSL